LIKRLHVAWRCFSFSFSHACAADLGLPAVNLLRSARPAGLSLIFPLFQTNSNLQIPV
jgi:hypothetical protein